MKVNNYHFVFILLLALFCTGFAQIRPNIVFILTDDQGIGDVSAYNPQALFTTPAMDSLATLGMMFTDAHSPWSSCMPSRYGLMTGRWPFRGGNMNVWREEPLINDGRTTLASLLKDNGYHTGAVGKWHLGFNHDGNNNLDNLTGGPLDRGFDYYFGISRSLDQADYYYIHNRSATIPDVNSWIDVPERLGTGPRETQGYFWREGIRAPDFEFAEVMYHFQDSAIAYIEKQAADTTRPFFLYVPLASPHSPWLPAQEYLGTTELGKMDGDEAMYGDWMSEIDDVVGRIVNKIYDLGLKENTMIFFSSDNGPNWWSENIAATGHDASDIYTGEKFSVYEGGHRVPFIVSWPGVIPMGATSSQFINFTDMMATFAAITGTALANNEGEDSYNIWPALLNPDLATPVRGDAGIIGEEDYIRQGDWKLVSNDELYNIAQDPSENNNVYNANSSIADDLDALRDQYHSEGRSTPTGRPAEPIIFGCMDNTSPFYVPTATVEPANSCTGGMAIRAAQAASHFQITTYPGSFVVSGASPWNLQVTNIAGKTVYSGKGTGRQHYPYALLKNPGVYLIRVSSHRGGTSEKVLYNPG